MHNLCASYLGCFSRILEFLLNKKIGPGGFACGTWWDKDLCEIEVGILEDFFSINRVILLILLMVFAGL